MKYGQDTDGFFTNAMDDNVRQSGDRKEARFPISAWSTRIWQKCQSSDRIRDTFDDTLCGLRIVPCDIIMNRLDMPQRALRIGKPHFNSRSKNTRTSSSLA